MFVRQYLCNWFERKFPNVLHCSVMYGRDPQWPFDPLLSRFGDIYALDRHCSLSTNVWLRKSYYCVLFNTGTVPNDHVDSWCFRPFVGTDCFNSMCPCLPSIREVILQLLHTCKTFFIVYFPNFRLYAPDKIINLAPIDWRPIARLLFTRICWLNAFLFPLGIFYEFHHLNFTLNLVGSPDRCRHPFEDWSNFETYRAYYMPSFAFSVLFRTHADTSLCSLFLSFQAGTRLSLVEGLYLKEAYVISKFLTWCVFIETLDCRLYSDT